LKYELQGYWSRRITNEHRLVYKIEEDLLIILSCKYHYD
ncbi:MAG: Txe/YoeB family addiction module toxin, partial [Dolichospermum sp.]